MKTLSVVLLLVLLGFLVFQQIQLGILSSKINTISAELVGSRPRPPRPPREGIQSRFDDIESTLDDISNKVSSMETDMSYRY